MALVPLAASADDDKRVVIAERNHIVAFDPATGVGTQAGTFHAAGAISDSGTATAPGFTVTPLGDGRARLEGDHILSSPQGTIVIHSVATVFPFPSPRVIAKGTWKVVSGTGAYAGAEGRGKVLAVGDFTTGTATIMRDGYIRLED